jgi:hypothetical protein
VVLLKDASIDANLLSLLIHKVMSSYQMSVSFIQHFIVEPIEKSNLSVLEAFPVITLSALSKGLYIYELEKETKHIEV